MSKIINAKEASLKHGTNSHFAVEIWDNANCAVVTVEMVTQKLVKFKEELIGVFGVPMMKVHALPITMAIETPKDQVM